jgi:hypothetical protein
LSRKHLRSPPIAFIHSDSDIILVSSDSEFAGAIDPMEFSDDDIDELNDNTSANAAGAVRDVFL